LHFSQSCISSFPSDSLAYQFSISFFITLSIYYPFLPVNRLIHLLFSRFPIFFFYSNKSFYPLFLISRQQLEHSRHHKLFAWYFAFISFSNLVNRYLGVLIKILILFDYFLGHLLICHWLRILKNFISLFWQSSQTSFSITASMQFLSRIKYSKIVLFPGCSLHVCYINNIFLWSLILMQIFLIVLLFFFRIMEGQDEANFVNEWIAFLFFLRWGNLVWSCFTRCGIRNIAIGVTIKRTKRIIY